MNLRKVQVGVSLAVVADLVGLAALGVHSVRTTTTATTTTPAASQQQVAAPPAVAPSAAPAAAPVVAQPAPVVAPVVVPSPTRPSPETAPKPSKHPTAAATSVPASPTPAGTSPVQAPSVQQAPCPLPLPTPPANANGGLQSVITFAPVFGPYTPEAFAAAAAYAPVLKLVGPVLAKYPEYAPVLEPALAPLLSVFESLVQQGYDLTIPFYAPYRQQVIDAEIQVATALAPYSQQLAASPGASCLVDIESALLGAAS